MLLGVVSSIDKVTGTIQPFMGFQPIVFRLDLQGTIAADGHLRSLIQADEDKTPLEAGDPVAYDVETQRWCVFWHYFAGFLESLDLEETQVDAFIKLFGVSTSFLCDWRILRESFQESQSYGLTPDAAKVISEYMEKMAAASRACTGPVGSSDPKDLEIDRMILFLNWAARALP